MKIAIVGLGAAGAAALLDATARGLEVTGFEQFGIGHDLGSSHGASRLIRRTYPDAFHSRWMARAYEAWSRVEGLTGENLFVKCGGLTFGPENDPTLLATHGALADCGISHEVLAREAVVERFPVLDIGQGALGIYQADSGFLRADRCVRSQVDSARKLGAVVHERCKVIEIVEAEGRVTVVSDHGSECYDAVVVTAGPWVGKLLPGLELPVQVVLRQTIYLGLDDDEGRFAPGRFPVWIHHPTDHYGFPSDGVLPGIKVACHHGGPDFDPALPGRPVMNELTNSVRDHVLKHVTSLSGEIVSAKACLYTVTPDERFILDFVPGSRRQIVCSGCSGHGFKFSALLGELAVGMAREGECPADSEPWRLARFK
jgi:sarcosine oxidase